MSGSRASIAMAAIIAAAAAVHAESPVTDLVGAAKRGDEHAVRHLLESRPDAVEDRDADGYTALHWAGIRGHWRIVATLTAAGAPVDAVGGDGGTPLHWACHHDRADMVALLLDAGADLRVANRWGRTPLHVAARRGCTEVARLLIARGADVSAATREGWTPLHVAAMSDHPALVELLLNAGADPSARDGDGRTPAEVARRRPQPVDIDPSTLETYVGIYDLGGGSTAKIWLEKGGLRIREFAPDRLVAVGPDTFMCEQEPWKVVFLRTGGGPVDGVELHFLRRTVAGRRLASPRYVGSAACAGCHSEGERGGAYVRWLASRHGHAYWRLAADWALYLAKLRPWNADVDNPREDERCLMCHVTGRQDDDALFAASFRAEEGVGCESCHGPGSLYADPEVMADRGAFLAAGGRVPDEATCRGCHRNEATFDFAVLWPKIEHGGEEAGR